MKRFFSVIAIALVLGLAAGNAEAAKGDKAAKKAGGKGAAVAGTVVKVDGTNLVVMTKGKKGAEVTVATDATTEVKVNGAKGALTDLKAGMNVTVTPNTGTAKEIVAGAGKDKPKKAKKAK